MWGIIMWNFYYDEAFHDRKITVKNNSINVYAENSSDIYTGFFIGFNEVEETEFFEKYALFEKKYKEFYTIADEEELKGTTIGKKNYRNGFATFNKNTLNFYNEFFDILNDGRVIFHIGMFSKTELIVNEFLRNVIVTCQINRSSFLYSLTKFLYTYRNQPLLIEMMQCENCSDVRNVIDSLLEFMQNIIDRSFNSKRKHLEKNALIELVCVLRTAQIFNFRHSELGWRYEQVFIGFNKLLNERSIKQTDVNLFIDTEANTLKAAKAVSEYNKCDELRESKGLRISDILSHFFGSLALSLESAFREVEIHDEGDLDKIDYAKKNLIPKEWFNISENQFLLYHKIMKIFNNFHAYEWTGYDSNFGDSPVIVFCLLRYFLNYDIFEKFSETPNEMHCEYFNTSCCEMLKFKFARGGSEPAEKNYFEKIGLGL